ncbi:hypothetical protein ACET3Z_010338 [Daucus carota]
MHKFSYMEHTCENQTLSLGKKSGNKSFTAATRALSISWGHTPTYRTWSSNYKSRKMTTQLFRSRYLQLRSHLTLMSDSFPECDVLAQRVRWDSLAAKQNIFPRQRGMTTPTQTEEDLYSTANSSESLVDPIHYSLSQSLPLEERYKLDRDWKRQEAEHSYSEAKKNYELHMGLEVEETKSLVDNLTAYKGHLEEDRLRELLMLQWRVNGSAAELEEVNSAAFISSRRGSTQIGYFLWFCVFIIL